MLEPIVEDDRLSAQLVDGDPRCGDPVAVLHVRHVGQRPFELERLVVRSAVVGAVAPARQGDPHALAERSRRATHFTMGVLPVPPRVRFPTLINGDLDPGNQRFGTVS